MVLITGLLGVLGRFAGKLLTTALGWASTLLFGRVSKMKQTTLAGVTLLSLVWVAAIVGVVNPDIGTILVAAVPAPSFVSKDLLRLVLLVVGLVAPLVVGGLVVWMQDAGQRPHGTGLLGALLRGYPIALALDVTIVWLGVVAIWLKLRALSKHWEDAHVPVIVERGRYDAVVDDLEAALDDADLPIERRPASLAISLPTRLLVMAAGQGFSSLVPDRFAKLVRDDLEIQVHPADLAFSGAKHPVARARAEIALKLASSDAYLTEGADAHRLEDRLADLAKRVERLGGSDRGVRNGLAEVDAGLRDRNLSFEDWQILYRVRLQVERDLLAAERERATGRPADPRRAAEPEGAPRLRLVGALSTALSVASSFVALWWQGRRDAASDG